MFGLRFTIDAHARSKNGQPAQNTTGVASARPIQFTARMPSASHQRPRRAMSAIVSTNTGAPSSSADPEAARHVDQLGIRRVLERDHARLERHAADRAGARRVADDLRVHRAGVFDLRQRRRIATGPASSAMPHFGHAPGCRLPNLRIHRADVAARAGHGRRRRAASRRRRRPGMRRARPRSARGSWDGRSSRSALDTRRARRVGRVDRSCRRPGRCVRWDRRVARPSVFHCRAPR